MIALRVILILFVYAIGTATGGAIESGTNAWWYAFVAVVSLATVLMAVGFAVTKEEK